MKRAFGIGDILYGLGMLLVFVFVLLNMLLVPKGYYDMLTAWPLVNAIILELLVLGAVGLFVMSLISNPKIITVQYIFAGFLVIMHLADFTSLMPYPIAKPGMPFYVFVGALLIGIGTYVIQQGMGAITGEKAKGK